MKKINKREMIHGYYNKGDFSEIVGDVNQNNDESDFTDNYRPLNQAGDDWTTDDQFTVESETGIVNDNEDEIDENSQSSTLREFNQQNDDNDDNDESKIPKSSILNDPRIEMVEKKLKENCENFDKIIDAIEKFLLIVQDRRKNLGDKVWSATVEQEVKLLVKKYKEKAMAAQNRFVTYQKIVNEKICELDYKHQQQKEDIKFWKSQTGSVSEMIPELNKLLHREQESLQREKQEIIQALEQFLSSSLSSSMNSSKHKKG